MAKKVTAKMRKGRSDKGGSRNSIDAKLKKLLGDKVRKLGVDRTPPELPVREF